MVIFSLIIKILWFFLIDMKRYLYLILLHWLLRLSLILVNILNLKSLILFLSFLILSFHLTSLIFIFICILINTSFRLRLFLLLRIFFHYIVLRVNRIFFLKVLYRTKFVFTIFKNKLLFVCSTKFLIIHEILVHFLFIVLGQTLLIWGMVLNILLSLYFLNLKLFRLTTLLILTFLVKCKFFVKYLKKLNKVRSFILIIFKHKLYDICQVTISCVLKNISWISTVTPLTGSLANLSCYKFI